METRDPIFIAKMIILAQTRHMQAYQLGQLPPQWAIDSLEKYMPIWEELIRDGKI